MLALAYNNYYYYYDVTQKPLIIHAQSLNNAKMLHYRRFN